jgi:ADP-ribose pyrophosphatase
MMDESVSKTQEIYSGRVIKLSVLDVTLPNGVQAKRELVTHPGAVALVALDEAQNVLLVRQYRIAARRIMLELPAGTLNPAEAPDVCAVRELQEETGYKPGKLEALGGFFVAPGYTTEYIHLFLATDLIESRLAQDEDEMIELIRMPLVQAVALVEVGELIDAKTVTGLLRVARRLNL